MSDRIEQMLRVGGDSDGVGEAVDDLVPFDPSEYARALLGDDVAH